MAKSYDINEALPDDETPCVKHETERAKLYLQKFCPEAGDNLYNHISEVLAKILAERPKNAFATFDEYSRRLRDDKFRLQNNHLRDVYVPPPQYKDAKKLIDLFKVNLSIGDDRQSLDESNERHDVNKEVKESMPNLFDLFYYFEQADIGLPRAEMVLLNLSIRKLIAKTKIEDVRFWGKILGRSKNYYIIEVTLPEYEIKRRLGELEAEDKALKKESTEADVKEVEQENTEKEALEAAMATKLSDIEREDEAESIEEDDTLKLVFPPIPKNTWKAMPEVSPEKLGTGTNAKVYFICNSPGFDDWVELPCVTPQQIVVARQIIHLFTGNLDAEIHTFPSFPGREKNYLRAQIARIGAATHISPIDYFAFAHEEQDGEEEMEEDEEEEVEGEGGGELVKNRRYEQPPIKDLIDPSMSSWCHHTPYILKQGRVTWREPGETDDYADENKEDEGEDEEKEKEGETDEEEYERESEDSTIARDKGFEKEIEVPLLTPLSEDVASDNFVTPWTARQSSRIQPDTAVALVRSNVWPGAFAFAADKKFGNVYIGWGHKHHAYNYGPTAMPAVEEQYRPIDDSELREIRDPSFEEEEAYRLAHLPPPPDDGEEEEESEDATDVDDED